MKTRFWGLGIVLVVSLAAIACVTYGYQTVPVRSAPTEVASPREDGSDQPFYDDLAPYGRWVNVSGPGWVWSPYGVQATWRPYLLGHWVFTDYGWTWASDESWGWAVYHYGRWHQDASYGWVWVPGTEWGPAWVAWHEGGGYVGWAPLPWQVRVQAGVGIDWAGVNVSLQTSSWCFVSSRNLVDPGLRNYVVPPARNVNLIRVTQNVTNYTYIDNRVVNQGVRVESIGRAVGHTIPRYRIADTESPETTRGGGVRGQDFVVYRPDPRGGRHSQGRTDPPGHERREGPRDGRGRWQQSEPANTGTQQAPPAQPPPAQPPATTEPPQDNRGQDVQNHGRDAHQSRGRRFTDVPAGQQPPASPQNGATPPAPPQNPPPNAPSAQSSGNNKPPADARPGNPAPGNPPGATTPPGRPPQANGQNARPNERGKKNNPPKDEKQKQDKPKQEDADKSKGQNASSDH